MQRELLEVLACPVCQGDLEISVTEESGTEVISGSLYCRACGTHYPITEAIPDLLPPEERSNPQ
jgi:uncharacterized protein YbaR (Trm112 family)